MFIARRFRLAAVLSLAMASGAQAADNSTVVAKATMLLEEISANSGSGIPPKFLQEAKGILIMPHIVENKLGVGRKKGHGVILRRNENGEWGDARPVEISGLSLGAEAGRMVSDAVVLFRTQNAADRYSEQSFALEAYAYAAEYLGHRHHFNGPGPDSNTKKDVLVYLRRHGLVVGAAVAGERKRTPAVSPPNSKTSSISPSAAPAPETKASVKVTTLDAPANRLVDSPEVTHLKRVLTAMTAPTQAAGAGSKDPMVSPTSGQKPNNATNTKSTGLGSP